MTILLQFGINLKKERLKKNLTQEELANISDFHRTYIGYLENGKRNITLLSLVRLSKALGCNIEDLVNGLDSMDSNNLKIKEE